MQDYQTKGTPYFILVNELDHIVFADFSINVDGAIRFFNEELPDKL